MKNIVIIGDSFIILELCEWLTACLAGANGKLEDAEKKRLSGYAFESIDDLYMQQREYGNGYLFASLYIFAARKYFCCLSGWT